MRRMGNLCCLVVAIWLAGCFVRPLDVQRDRKAPEEVVVREESARATLRWVRPCEFTATVIHPLLPLPRPAYAPRDELVRAQSAPVASADGSAYLVYEGRLHKLALITGRPRWRFPVGVSRVQVCESEGIALVYEDLRGEGILRGLDAESGDVLWSREDMESGARILLDEGRAYCQGPSDVAVFDAKTGEPLWRRQYPFGAEYYGSVNTLLASGGGVVMSYRTNERGVVETHAIDFFSGGTNWFRNGTPLQLDGSTVWILREEMSRVLGRDLETGELRADYAATDFDRQFVHLRGDRLIYSSTGAYFRPREASFADDPEATRRESEVRAVDLSSGEVLWYFTYRNDETEIVAFQVVEDTLILLRDPIDMGGGDIVFGRMEVRSMEDGGVLWFAHVPHGIVKVSGTGRHVLASSRDGWVYAFEWTDRP